ncbi:GGDEF domain-containing protein [Leifsonia shinshuensis]|uniref:Sensor domain-containing diguanylate cyclase n=1 Tax=Leifsonia shinshuensis TaxID=150026 RepID=A0A7G6YE03_9MICO|nr:sensor domain-containing diguanylate cyclase [Leifsonia shinshuensis]QNE36718.1 sensor domain-containing diguanylate cyclase [Leifsonia shinshuensis]
MRDEIARMQPFPRALVDRSHTVVDTNLALEVWASRTSDELVGMPLAAVLGVDAEELSAALATGNPGGIRLATSTHAYQGTRSSVVIKAVRISGGHTIVAFDPELAAVGERTMALGRRESDRLQLLLSASVAFAKTRTEEELGELLSQTARRAFNATAASVHTGEPGNYALVAGENLLEAEWPKDASGDSPQLGNVVTIQSPAEADEIAPGLGLGGVFERSGVSAVIGVPIIEDDVLYGAFACYFDQPRRFDDQAVPLAEALAQLAGQVLVRLRLEARLRRAAMLDEVTGLPNRRLFDENLHQTERAHTDQVAVLFVDLDGFKAINDTLGHAAGDTVLKEVGERLSSVFRQEDMIARYGGDEFIAVLHVADTSDALELADRARAAIAQDFAGIPRELNITASVGIAIAEGDVGAHAIDRLIRLADQAMYAAKRGGGDQAVVHGAER